MQQAASEAQSGCGCCALHARSHQLLSVCPLSTPSAPARHRPNSCSRSSAARWLRCPGPMLFLSPSGCPAPAPDDQLSIQMQKALSVDVRLCYFVKTFRPRCGNLATCACSGVASRVESRPTEPAAQMLLIHVALQRCKALLTSMQVVRSD